MQMKSINKKGVCTMNVNSIQDHVYNIKTFTKFIESKSQPLINYNKYICKDFHFLTLYGKTKRTIDFTDNFSPFHNYDVINYEIPDIQDYPRSRYVLASYIRPLLPFTKKNAAFYDKSVKKKTNRSLQSQYEFEKREFKKIIPDTFHKNTCICSFQGNTGGVSKDVAEKIKCLNMYFRGQYNTDKDYYLPMFVSNVAVVEGVLHKKIYFIKENDVVQSTSFCNNLELLSYLDEHYDEHNFIELFDYNKFIQE